MMKEKDRNLRQLSLTAIPMAVQFFGSLGNYVTFSKKTTGPQTATRCWSSGEGNIHG